MRSEIVMKFSMKSIAANIVKKVCKIFKFGDIGNKRLFSILREAVA